VMICYSIAFPDSLANVCEKWVSEVIHFCARTPVILVGCKSDLRPPHANSIGLNGNAESASSSSPMENGGGSGQYVTTEQGRRIAQQIGAREYKECSALKAEGVDDVFEAATRASMLIRDRVRHGGGRPKQRRREEEDAGGCCVVA